MATYLIVKSKTESRSFNRFAKFVYVIGLHAVQFGNNWMKKILRTAKIGRGSRPRVNSLPRH